MGEVLLRRASVRELHWKHAYRKARTVAYVVGSESNVHRAPLATRQCVPISVHGPTLFRAAA